jgi:hypothetical protein
MDGPHVANPRSADAPPTGVIGGAEALAAIVAVMERLERERPLGPLSEEDAISVGEIREILRQINRDPDHIETALKPL